MDKEAMYTVATYYTIIAAIFSWTAQFTPVADHLANPTLQALGLVVFAVGQSGNLYHHMLLANLRKEKAQSAKKSRYNAPKGGLFSQVACPHYFFELFSFFGHCHGVATGDMPAGSLWSSKLLCRAI
uniref:3-oxo-5-alpha-steroid 4-dehydrogenase C-terminal domain-containing protein n=1 Tax=Odontella aurita TaxID=265563 RepID=A0A7S4K503_9STRA|mmetsp:Transcript_61721/g.182301  ORF Transcript_61721/g.182301 Transcript_61721/m.182301 type:complete len:127 (+) Transcript_61721:233-613(+)